MYLLKTSSVETFVYVLVFYVFVDEEGSPNLGRPPL